MSRPVMALLGIAVLVSVGEWLSMFAANRVDMRLIPVHSRRRVAWLRTNSTHIQVGCATVAAVLLGMQAALVLA